MNPLFKKLKRKSKVLMISHRFFYIFKKELRITFVNVFQILAKKN